MTTSIPTDRCPLRSLFRLSERQTTVRREIGAGVTTFMVMAYIIFVNPAILSFAGMTDWESKGPPFPQVMVATCFASALMTLLMGLVSNRPFALAPGMGLNAVVAYQLIIGMGLTWQEAMGVVLVEGLVVTLLVLVGLREAVMRAVPASLKHSIAVGIGCFIFFIGLINGGLVRVPVETIAVVGGVASGQPATPLALGALGTVSVCMTLFGLAVTVLLSARGWQSALLLGMILTTVLATAVNSLTGGASLAVGAQLPESLWALPDLGFLALPGVQGTAGMFAKLGLLSGMLVVFSLMLTDFFDTMGTILGVAHQLGDVGPAGEVERLRPMLLIDSLAAVAGGAVGASSVTTYVESAAGVAAGGRTGLTSVTTALLFALAMFLAPLAGVIPPQATAPALILVGFLMARGLRAIDWSSLGEGFPALVTILVMPLTYSITNGIGCGFISHVAIQVCEGRGRQVHPLLWCTAVAFLLYFALPWLETLGLRLAAVSVAAG
ncbi:MAG: NCS2 family permease [Candidatus Anammoximicrobium sp.]|nr:NCS2 family permease [Candidatus Anammoximicrobium sp.]